MIYRKQLPLGVLLEHMSSLLGVQQHLPSADSVSQRRTHTHTPRHICRPPPTVYNWPRRRRRPARRRLLCSSFHRTKPPGGKGQRGNKDFALQKRTPALLIWRRRPLATSLDNRLAVPSRHGPATQQGELQRQRQRQRPPDC